MGFNLDVEQSNSFFQFSPELMAVLGEEGQFLEVNPSWENQLNFSPQELKDNPFFSLLHPQDIAKAQNEIAKLTQGEERVSFEGRLKGKSGSLLHFHWTCIYSSSNHRIYLSGRDVTELKKTQESLEQSRARFQRLSESSNEGVAIHDRVTIMEANQVLASMMGYEKAEDLVGKSVLELIALEYRELVLKHIQTAYDKPFEVMGQRKDMTRFNCQLSGKSILHRGRELRFSTFLDVTKIKERERELFESQELFRKLAEASKDGIAVSDRGNILMANPALARMLGCGISELIGRNALEFTAPEFRETLLRKILDEVETPYEVMGLKADGTRFPVEISARMTSYQGGRVRVSFFRDITLSRQIKEEILRQKEFTQNLLNSSLDGFMAFDQECRYTLWNPAMERMTGYSREEVLGQCAFDLFPFLKQIGQDRYFYDALDGKSSITKDQPYRTPEGKQGFIESSYSPIKNAVGEIIGGLGVIHDTTERIKADQALRQSEMNLKAVFNNTFQNIILMSREGRIQAFNSNAAVDIQEKSGKVLGVGRSIFEYEHPENAELLKENLEQVLQGEAVQYERTFLMGDGEDHWYEINFHPVFDKDGEIDGICFSSLNIDDRKRAEAEIQKSEADLRAVFNSSLRGFILAGTNGKIRDFNQNARRNILEIRGLELSKGRPLSEFIEPSFLKTYRESFKKVLQGEILHYERLVHTAQGRDQWFELSFNPVSSPEEKVLGFCFSLVSIDARKRAEKATLESEEKFRRVFEKATLGMTLVDKDLHFLNANRAFCEMIGYTEHELETMSIRDITFPEDLAETLALAKKNQKGVGFTVQKRYVHRKGHILWANLTVTSFLDTEGKFLYSLGLIEDITEKKLAQEALKESQERLQMLSEVTQEGILLHENSIIMDVNPALADMIGFSREEMIGRSGFDLLAPESHEAARRHMKRGSTEPYEALARRKDGSLFPVELQGKSFHFKKRELRVICVRDITWRQKAEKTLRESEERYRRLVEDSPVGMCVIQGDGVIVFANPESAKLFKVKGQKDLVGKTIMEFIPPEDRALVKERMRLALEDGIKSRPREGQLIRVDGQKVDAEITGIPIVFQGHRMVVGIYRDITQKKKTERALVESQEGYRVLVESSPEALLVHNEEKILYVNPAGIQLFGAKKMEDLVGQPFLKIVRPDFHEQVLQRVRRSIREGVRNEPLERKLAKLNGQEIDVQATSIPFTYQGQKAVLAIIRDISESKKAQQTILHYERLAAVGKVIAAIAHEIRNPLAMVSGMSQILEEKLRGRSEFSTEVETLLAQANRLKLFMNDILNYSRDLTVQKRKISPRPLLESSLKSVQTQIGSSRGSIQVKWKWDRSFRELWADEERLEQVLVNLLLNAYQALGEKGTLMLSGGIEKEWAVIRIQDNGPGIQEGDMPRLFEPFFTTKKHGTGLGLSISQKIMEAHGGKIEVKSVQPHGSLFTIRLPNPEKK